MGRSTLAPIILLLAFAGAPAAAQCTDADGDGVCTPADCDDGDANTYPGAREICDGVNNDCDDPDWPALPPAETEDADEDGVVEVCDNCPEDSNPAQLDADSDDVGDACDNCRGVDTPTSETERASATRPRVSA